ncbi:MAG: glycine cleavage system protein H [Anaerolineaceae bacterium 4572_32.1]|nr:MAG: glycine cleavage system protein H [Anaerolineaceae bacterium 4572_32.1]
MKIDPNCLYAESHEWIRVEGDEGVVGISDHAQSELSDIVYVELPESGDSFDKGEVYGTVESVKAAADVYLPVSGEILEINEILEDSPELVNSDPYTTGWFVRISIANPAELDDLMDAAAYEIHCQKEGGQ